ncbi:hypothetical protein Goshw_007892 [Gossypium schwendimanii]|uniref:RNase H type-1 domain-containing protein n=1 Tax=Gossypium schwendimanii TaxID=34291 RepID=A0A7J9MXA1_GOSSC|nr:hypothetical protein [Gossypium schwendimanii]
MPEEHEGILEVEEAKKVKLKEKGKMLKEQVAQGSKGGLCLAWKGDTKVSLRSLFRNHIDVIVEEEQGKEEWRFTGFHGSPFVHNKSDTTWKQELIAYTFPEDVAEMILSIPLAERPHEDFQVWSVEATDLDAVGKNKLQPPIPVKIWTKPVDRVVKINFDAAYDGRQSKAAIGVVARDKEGLVLLLCTDVHQRVSSAFGAEAIACRKALQIGINMQWEKVIIEGDSLSIIRKCKTKRPDKSLVSAYIHYIHQLLFRFKECRFEHISRLANNLAHILSNEALKSSRGAYLVGRVPEAAELQAEIERVREPD